MLVDVPTEATDKIVAILQVFEDASGPLTVGEALNRYQGPTLGAKPAQRKKEIQRVIEQELLPQSKLRVCAPSGKQARYWTKEEGAAIDAAIKAVLHRGPLPASDLAKAVGAQLPAGVKQATIKDRIQILVTQSVLFAHPKKRGKPALGLHAPDPFAEIAFKPATLKDLNTQLRDVLSKGGTVEKFWRILLDHLPIVSPPPTSTLPTVTTKPLSEPEIERATPPSGDSLAEVEEMILKGMLDLEPRADRGAPVRIVELRAHMPLEYRDRTTFDAAILRLASADAVVIHKHNTPHLISESERSEMVEDALGNFYHLIAYRV